MIYPITLPAIERDPSETGGGRIVFRLPPGLLRDLVWHTVKLVESSKRGPWFRLVLGPVRRIRTTGERSQNHRINGFIQQLCMHTGMEFDVLKFWLKKQAIRRGYPFDTDPSGDAVPWSESRISVEEAVFLNDEIEQYAAEIGCTLREHEEEKRPSFSEKDTGGELE